LSPTTSKDLPPATEAALLGRAAQRLPGGKARPGLGRRRRLSVASRAPAATFCR
jgi:hypothetical protein